MAEGRNEERAAIRGVAAKGEARAEFPAVVYTSLRASGISLYVMFLGLVVLAVIVTVVEQIERRPPDGVLGMGIPMLLVSSVITYIAYRKHVAGLAPLRRRFAPFRTEVAFSARSEGRDAEGRTALYEDQIGALLFFSKVPECGSGLVMSLPGTIWRDVAAHAYRVGVPLPRSIVSDTLSAGCKSIPLTSDLLEPEPIEYTTRYPKWVSAIFLGAIVINSLMAARTGFVMSYVAAGVMAFVLLSHRYPWLRWHRWIGSTDKAPVAGCGVIKSVEGHRFTCRDSLMLVQSDRSSGAPVVSFIMPPTRADGAYRSLRITFASTTDPHFVELWRRWNHLDPKPDLLT